MVLLPLCIQHIYAYLGWLSVRRHQAIACFLLELLLSLCLVHKSSLVACLELLVGDFFVIASLEAMLSLGISILNAIVDVFTIILPQNSRVPY